MNIDCDCHDHDIFRKLNPGEKKKITLAFLLFQPVGFVIRHVYFVKTIFSKTFFRRKIRVMPQAALFFYISSFIM